jgi:RND family efflux transporter MFP subunit
MERNESQPFDQQTINTCEQTLALLSPFLKLKQDDELLFIQKMAKAAKNFFAGLFGFKYLGFKLLSLAVIAIICFSLLVESEYRIHANAVLEGRIQRTIPAPMKGFIDSAEVRAGDTVSKQQIMASMEDVDLKLEKIRLAAEQLQLQREYRDAMAKRDLVQVRILNAQLTQVSAKIKLKSEQLQRTIIRAPFDGIVIKGDLSQQLGAPVERGDSLFTIAPLDGYRIILKVDERSISYLQQGQKGILALSSLPDSKFPLRIEKITQVASADDGSNIFRVEATLDKLPKLLRPGMEGIGKVDVGRKKLFWIWTHGLVDWVKLWVWSWWP